jgi:phosphoserine phosphatase
LKAVEERYWETIVTDAQAVLEALRFLGKEIFIISGGLAEPVRGFGQRLGVAPEHIRAVELEYNELVGDWWRYYEPSTQHKQAYMDYRVGPLTVSSGKPTMIKELAGDKPGRRLMVGDGMSDLVTRDVVDLFVGFGGVVARAKVRDNAAAFIESASLAPILPIAAGPIGYQRIKGTPHQAVFDRGLELALSGGLSLKNDTLLQAFEKAFAL